jgi:hypothetical protein
MTISVVGVGTAQQAVNTGTASISVTPTLPAGAAAGDRIYLMVANSPATTTPNTPTGWTSLNTQSLGTGTLGATTGPRRLTLFWRDYDGAWAMPTVTLPSVAAPALLAQSIAIRKAANEAWVAPTTTQGSDVTVTGTTYSATAAATLPVTAGDGLMAAVVTPGTVTTTTGVVSATGLTVGTVGKQADWASVSATNGVSAHLFVGLPSAGTATAPMVNTATVSVSGQSSGGTIFVRQPVIPKLETITDDFATQDTAKWTFAAAAAVTSGQVVCTPSTAWDAYFEAKAVYDLTGSSYVVELVQATATGTGGSLETYVELDSGGTHTNPMLLFRKVAGNLLSVWRNSSGTETTVNTAAYSATNHRWLRIRESGGTVFWEVSANGLSWNSYGSVATPFNITSLGVRQGCGTNTAEGSPGTAIFDNVNLPPTGTNYTASPADTAAASDAASAVQDMARTAADTARCGGRGLCGAGHGADGRRHRWGGGRGCGGAGQDRRRCGCGYRRGGPPGGAGPCGYRWGHRQRRGGAGQRADADRQCGRQ